MTSELHENKKEQEEEDEDAWYARMEQASYQNDDLYESQSESLEQINQDKAQNDDDYFEKLDRIAKSGENTGAFVDEDNAVWQSMLRKIASDNNSIERGNQFKQIKASDELEIMLCRQWLFSHLPNSLTLYHMTSGPYLVRNPNRCLFIDHTIHPSIAFSYIYKDIPRYLQATIFCSNNSSECLFAVVNSLYAKARSLPQCKSLYLFSSDNEIFERAFVHDSRLKVEWIELCKMHICDPGAMDVLRQASSALPEGYEYCELTWEDADIINGTWKYRSEESIHMVRKMINDIKKCKGIRHHEDGLVAWCLTYEDGPVGMLYTLPNHRQKGLGRCVVAELIIYLLTSENTEAPPFCYIEQSNEASLKLFRSLGFYKTIDVMWSEFSFT